MFLGPHTSQSHYQTDPDVVGLASRYRLSFTRREAFSAVGRNRSVDDGAAIDAFPGIKNKKKV